MLSARDLACYLSPTAAIDARWALRGCRWSTERSVARLLHPVAAAAEIPGRSAGPGPSYPRSEASWRYADSPALRPRLSRCPWAELPRTIRHDARRAVFLSGRQWAEPCREA